MSETNIKEENTVPPVEQQEDALTARLNQIEDNLKGTIDRQAEVIENQNKKIEELMNRPNASQEVIDEHDGAILIDRQSAHTMRLPVVNDAPVISGKLERVIGVPGLEYLMKVKTAERDGEDYKEYLFPFGCDINKLDFNDKKLKGVETVSYENIKTKDFPLQDIDNNDLTGASKVEKGKIIGEGNAISEVDRSSGRPQLTGRKLRTVVRGDVRYYTIEHNGEKHVLSSNDLGNFRI